MQLFTFWRSLATLRVRIALNLKGILTEDHAIDLLGGQQARPEFKALNPQMTVPALVLDDGTVLFQSMAIIEYLEEAYPQPALLPQAPAARARVRALAQIPVADGHPLVTPRVRQYLIGTLALDEQQRIAWSRHWMGAALAAMEGHLAKDAVTGSYCHGDQITLADICLVSQVVGYGFFGGTLEELPTVARIHTKCMQHDAFIRAQPLLQADAPKG